MPVTVDVYARDALFPGFPNLMSEMVSSFSVYVLCLFHYHDLCGPKV